MDMEREAGRLKWLVLCAVLFVISCFFAYAEFVYLTFGRDARAAITATSIVQGRRSQRLRVDYQFTEPDGTQRTGSDLVSTAWTIPATRLVDVRYTPGPEGRSRLAENANWIWLAVFAISVTSIIAFIARVLIEAKRETQPIVRRPERW